MTIDITWAGNDAEFVGGADLRDKTELVGLPFRITGIFFTRNDKGIEYANVEAEDKDGEEFDFIDSSTTGIKHQLATFLGLKGITPKYDGEVYQVNIVCPKGLRVSEYEVQDMRGQAKMAKTYYLTSGGRAARRAKENAGTPAAGTKAKTA